MNVRGTVIDLYIYKEKGHTGTRVSHVDCEKGSGISGDIHARGGDRQITLMDLDLKKWMINQEQRGLCFDKFKENITIAGLDFKELKPGSKLCFGGVKLQITNWEKKCYSTECIIFEKIKCCPFPEGCLFASVLSSGSIFAGDEVRTIVIK